MDKVIRRASGEALTDIVGIEKRLQKRPFNKKGRRREPETKQERS